MPQLSHLQTALTQVIINYHHVKLPQSLVSPLSKDFTQKLDELKALITAATKSPETRKPLLEYFLHVISKINTFVTKEEIMTDDIAQFKTMLNDFFTNMQKLLNTSHSATVIIQQADKQVSLYGFVRSALRAHSWCDSGQEVKALLNNYRLEENSPESHIQQLVNDLIHENLQQREIARLTAEVNTLQEKVQALETANPSLTEASVVTRLAVPPSSLWQPATHTGTGTSTRRRRGLPQAPDDSTNDATIAAAAHSSISSAN